MDLAQALGNLPLAIKLAGAQIADGVPIDELLGELRTEIFELKDLDLPGTDELVDSDTRKRLSVQAAFHLSLRRLTRPIAGGSLNPRGKKPHRRLEQ